MGLISDMETDVLKEIAECELKKEYLELLNSYHTLYKDGIIKYEEHLKVLTSLLLSARNFNKLIKQLNQYAGGEKS